jgi:hypothetical protein
MFDLDPSKKLTPHHSTPQKSTLSSTKNYTKSHNYTLSIIPFLLTQNHSSHDLNPSYKYQHVFPEQGVEELGKEAA